MDASPVTERAGIEQKLELLLDRGWSRERLDSWRQARLTETFEAARRISFWRDRIGGADDIEAIVPLGRETLRDNFERMRRSSSAPTVGRWTSGSTGRPVRLEHGPGQIGFAAAARLRQLAWFGLPARQLPTANIWAGLSAADPLVTAGGEGGAELLINYWALSEDRLGELHDAIKGAGGVTLAGGTTSMLARWAELYEASPLDASELGVELAIVGGEMTYPEQRRAIERSFRCRTAEMYGSWEAQMIGCECPEGTLHVNEEVVAVELLTDDGTPSAAGEFGNVAVTLLHNPEFPLIRYLLGDVARRSPRGCPCERPQAALELGIARREEMISCRDGRRLHPRLIRSALERELGPRLRSFHTVQEAPGRFSSSVELDGGRLPARLAALIEAELRAGMDEDDVSVRVHQSDRGQIERLRGGKLRTFSNRCPERAAGG